MTGCARERYFVISVAPGAATLFGQTVTQRPFCLLHGHEVVAVVARSVEAKLALDRIDLVLPCQSASTLSSRLLVAVTATSSTCHAEYDAAACVSTAV